MGSAVNRVPPTTPRSSLLGGSFLRRLSSTISKVLDKSAYRDPTREMTNFGWRKKA
jgi:hypothetical protein